MNEPIGNFGISVYSKEDKFVDFISGNTKLELDRGIIKALKTEYSRIEIDIRPPKKSLRGLFKRHE